MAPRVARGGGQCSRVQQSNRRAQVENLQPTASYAFRGSSPVGSDDSTQAPDGFQSELGGPVLNQHVLGDSQEDNQIQRRGRGKAKGMEFLKLRKLCRVPVRVPDGSRGPSKDNCLVFASRVTYIVKRFANMRYKCWSLVPKEDKEELYNRVLGDFEMDWERFEDRECIKAKLAYSYKTYRYNLHNVYKKYPSKEVALSNAPEEIGEETWKQMCEQWDEDKYKSVCKRNTVNRSKLIVPHTSGSKSLQNLRAEKNVEEESLIEFYKRSHVTKRDDNFINDKAEHTYEEMMKLFAERDPTKTNLEVVGHVFHEVLGHKSGYTRGLGNSVIPTPSITSRSAHVTHLTQQVDKYKSEMETFKEQYLDVKATLEEFMARFQSYDEKFAEINKSQMFSNDETEAPTP